MRAILSFDAMRTQTSHRVINPPVMTTRTSGIHEGSTVIVAVVVGTRRSIETRDTSVIVSPNPGGGTVDAVSGSDVVPMIMVVRGTNVNQPPSHVPIQVDDTQTRMGDGAGQAIRAVSIGHD